MTIREKLKDWDLIKNVSGYLLFFLFSLLAFLFLTFPYQALKKVVEIKATEMLRMDVSISRISPAFGIGIDLHAITLREKGKEKGFEFEKATLTVSPASLVTFSPEYRISLKGYGGTARVNIAKDKQGLSEVRAEVNGIDIAQLGMELLPVEVSGTLEGTSVIHLTDGLHAGEDLMTGFLRTLSTGTVNLTMREGSVPFPKMKVMKTTKSEGTPETFTFQKMETELTLEKNVLAISSFEAAGGNYQAALNGRVDLVTPLMKSQVNVNLRFKPLVDIPQGLRTTLASSGVKQDQNKFYNYWNRGELGEALESFLP